MQQALTLFELNTLVRGVLQDAMDSDYWVSGELIEGREGYGGHFYGELVDKNQLTDQIVARARITIWARTWAGLSRRFHDETGQSLRPGLSVMLRVRVAFHEQYGYSLNVLDIDSRYTLGDMARRRLAILQQLTEDGVIDDNKALPLPRLLSRIAVISSATAAGYGDFRDQLLKGDERLGFHIELFPAVMQGEHVEASIIAALESIPTEQYDVVVIIRGGGATADLSDFDSYPLASCIAQYPLPVITGIGHERDETVLDHVAHTSLKTPTAVAAFILDHQLAELSMLEAVLSRIQIAAQRRLETERTRLGRHQLFFPLAFARMRERQLSRLDMLTHRLHSAILHRLEREKNRLDMAERHLRTMDPDLLLRRGYSITLCQGRVVRSAADVAPGEEIITRLDNGQIKSTVI